MNFIEFIKNLQQKPLQTRVKIMWVGVTVCMIFLVAFWFWSARSWADQTKQQVASDQTLDQLGQIKDDIPTLWQSLGAGISDVVNSLKETSGDQEPVSSPVNEPAISQPAANPDLLPVGN